MSKFKVKDVLILVAPLALRLIKRVKIIKVGVNRRSGRFKLVPLELSKHGDYYISTSNSYWVTNKELEEQYTKPSDLVNNLYG